MENQFDRTIALIGQEGLDILKRSRVAVFGLGGVGGYVVEALARTGVGSLDLIDNDTVSLSNINRQIIATHKTVGRYKVDLFEDRLLDINPDIKVKGYKIFYLPEEANKFDFSSYNYIVDAIDTVTAKIDLVVRASEASVPIISAMGAGNRLEPTSFCVCDLFETSHDPLAKVMRNELRKRGISSLKSVTSREEPIKLEKRQPASISFVPSVCGLVIASEVIKDLIKNG